MTSPPDQGKTVAGLETWLLRTVLIALLPMALTCLALVWFGDYTPKVRWTVSALVLGCCLWFPAFLNERIVFALRTIAGLLVSLREQDYTSRLSEDEAHGGALGEVFHQVNLLRDTLKKERTGAVETGALLEKVMANIDVAVFAFDEERRLKLLNERARGLLGKQGEGLLNRPARAFGLAECLEGPAPRIVGLKFGGRQGRWEIRRATFREEGQPHELLVLSDLTAPLRREELEAWQRLVRVLRHEISNSLAPISSFSQTLLWLIRQEPKPEAWEEDCVEGLEVIAERAAALNRMLTSYKGLSGLPLPQKGSVDVQTWLERVASLETRLEVLVASGPVLTIEGDADQLDQLLINLVRNAVDACQETGGGVSLNWINRDGFLRVSVEDEGPGLPPTEHLFVPFFTTKKEGSGIGLVLSRQIAEAHGGHLFLENREDGKGCRAVLELPVG